MKRFLAVILILSAMIPLNNFVLIPQLISFGAFKSYFVEPIDIKLTTAHPQNLKIYRTSSKGNVVELEEYTDLGSRFLLRGLNIVFLENEFDSFEKISVRLGDQVFDFTKNDLALWKKSNKVTTYQNALVLQFPIEMMLHSKTSSLLFWNQNLSQVINWSPHFGLGLLKVFALVLFYIIISLAVREIFLTTNLNENQTFSKFKPSLPQLIISGLFLLLALYFGRLGVDVHHQGFVFHAAKRLTEGKILFKEIYYHYGALTALMHAFALEVFGQRLYSLNILTSIFYCLISITFFNIMRKFLTQKETIFFTLLWIIFTPFLVDTFLPWSSVIALFFLMLTLNIFLIYMEKERSVYLVAIGIGTGLCFWARQSVGPLLLMAIFVTMSIHYFLQREYPFLNFIKKISIIFFGFIVCSLPFLIWIKSQDAMSDWWLQNMQGQGEWAFGGPIYKTKTLLKIFDIMLPFSFWGILPLITFLLFIIIFKNSYRNKSITTNSRQLIGLSVVGLASWPQYFPVPCNRHYFWAATPMFILLAVFITKIFVPYFKNRSFKRTQTTAVLFLFSLVLSTIFGEIVHRSTLIKEKLATHNQTIVAPEILKGMLIPSSDTVKKLEAMDEVLNKYLAEHPHSSIVGEEMYNQLFLTLVNGSELSSPLPSRAFNFGPLRQKYDFEVSQEEFIIKNKPLIYSPRPINNSNYKELIHLKFNLPLEYLAGEIYFYAPVTKDNVL